MTLDIALFLLTNSYDKSPGSMRSRYVSLIVYFLSLAKVVVTTRNFDLFTYEGCHRAIPNHTTLRLKSVTHYC